MTPQQWRQIEDLYNAARACEPQQREALLAATDPEIRSRLEKMLAVESGSNLFDLSLSSAETAAPLAPGVRLGPYEIEQQVGAGGMGTVYRALDTRLGRVVAIKLASDHYSERFQREARAISALNHPHLCTLYDVGVNYLVMEFIDGPTLAAELKKGPLPLNVALRYGVQIANALAEAHALGIVHRDLKPANIMLTRHGVKVLDFGLAKILSEAHSAQHLTQQGEIMGTPAYIAPEQVEGLEPQNTSDLFALGLVLYEMVAGRLPYPGASLGSLLATGSPFPIPAISSDRNIPQAFDQLIARLLENNPAKRPQTADKVARALSRMADSPPLSKRGLLRFSRPVLVLSLLVLLMAVSATGLWFATRSRRGVPPVPGPGSAAYTQLTSFTDAAVNPVLSPDGRLLAFFRSDLSFLTPDQIWVKLLPNGQPVQVTHDPRPKYNLAFSPDGSRIAFTALAPLFNTFSVSSLGGDSQLLLSNAAGLSWLDERRVLYSRVTTGVHMGVVTGLVDGSETRDVYFPSKDRGMAHYSYLSPDRKWVLLAEMDPEWLPCRLVPFDGSSQGRPVGPPNSRCVSAAWSPDGTWMYLSADVGGHSHLWRQRFPDGTPEQITFGSSEESGIAMAPDGRSLITSISTPQTTIWVHDEKGDRQLSTEGYVGPDRPVFSQSGKRLYFLLRHDAPEAPTELWRADLATGQIEAALSGVPIDHFDISQDEQQVVYSVEPAAKASQLWIAALDHSSPPRRLTASGESDPHFGPQNTVLFRFAENNVGYLGSIARDGSNRKKAIAIPLVNFQSISPGRRFFFGTLKQEPTITGIYAIDGSSSQAICTTYCEATWSPDGRYLYLEIQKGSRERPGGRTVAIPLPPGQSAPVLPPGVVRDPAKWAAVSGVKAIEHAFLGPSSNPAIYAWLQPSIHANLFRIQLQQ